MMNGLEWSGKLPDNQVISASRDLHDNGGGAFKEEQLNARTGPN